MIVLFAGKVRFVNVPALQASTSMMRELPANALFTSTRMRSVVIGENKNLRQIRLFPVTLPPGTSTQALPFQYCTSNAVMPHWVNVIVGVGSDGVAELSWTVNTSISPMLCGALKLTCTQS